MSRGDDGRDLLRLLSRGASLEELSLAYGRDAYPHLEQAEIDAPLDALAEEVGPRMRAQEDDRSRAHALLDFLYDEQGFGGDEGSYHDPRNSYLHEVLGRRRGIPITLAVVLMAVGRRAGFALEGVGFPGHFLARLGTSLIDPFEGVLLDEASLARLATRTLGSATVRAEHLLAVDPRTMLVRMLLNLKHAYERRSDHARALVVADRLVDLTSSIAFRRDRGLHALALGARESAVADLEAYLAQIPNPPDAAEVRGALVRARTASVSLS